VEIASSGDSLLGDRLRGAFFGDRLRGDSVLRS
jgi:hypothetical protein